MFADREIHAFVICMLIVLQKPSMQKPSMQKPSMQKPSM